MAISRRTIALSALIASGSCAVAQNAAPEQEVVPATGGARAWAHGQSLPVSDPREILASDPAAFIQLLDDFRPSPVTSEIKQMVLKSLPLELKGRAVNATGLAKLKALHPVLRAFQRDAVYDIRVIQSPWATIAIDGRAVLLISEPALGVLDANQLRAAVAHEAAHEYVWEEVQRADKRDDWKRLRELELVCDAIAVVILQQLGLETSPLIRAFEKLTSLNLLWLGPPPNPSRYPTLAERRKFAREVAAWMTGLSRKDANRPVAVMEQPDGTPQQRGVRHREVPPVGDTIVLKAPELRGDRPGRRSCKEVPERPNARAGASCTMIARRRLEWCAATCQFLRPARRSATLCPLRRSSSQPDRPNSCRG
jgi:hypothetical protein